jgi:D-lactate dehydrogenase (cytochrome)
MTMVWSRLCSSSRLIRYASTAKCRRLSVNVPESLPDQYVALQQRIPHVEFTTNIYERNRHGKGESHHPTAAPDVVATPTCTEDIRAIVQHCVQHRIPIIPFGVGTSVEGHVHALFGGLSLDTRFLQSIEIPDLTGDAIPDPIATVGAGVTRNTLNDALRHTGMQFSVDPGADATTGGETPRSCDVTCHNKSKPWAHSNHAVSR